MGRKCASSARAWAHDSARGNSSFRATGCLVTTPRPRQERIVAHHHSARGGRYYGSPFAARAVVLTTTTPARLCATVSTAGPARPPRGVPSAPGSLGSSIPSSRCCSHEVRRAEYKVWPGAYARSPGRARSRDSRRVWPEPTCRRFAWKRRGRAIACSETRSAALRASRGPAHRGDSLLRGRLMRTPGGERWARRRRLHEREGNGLLAGSRGCAPLRVPVVRRRVNAIAPLSRLARAPGMGATDPFGPLLGPAIDRPRSRR